MWKSQMPTDYSQTARFLGAFSVAFGLIELKTLVKMSPWTAVAYIRNPTLPAGCSQIGVNNPILYAKLWLTTAVTNSAIAGAISAWCILTLVKLWRSAESTGRVKRILTILCKVATYGLLLYVLSPVPQMQNAGCFSNYLRVFGSGALFYVSIALVMATVWAVQFRLAALSVRPATSRSLHLYIELRSMVQTLFALGSLILVCGVVQVGLRQRLITAMGGGAVSSRADVLLEGFRYTLLLAAAYIPVHLAFNIKGGSLLDTIIEWLPSLSGDEVKKWSEQKKAAEELLSLNSYEWKAFGPGLAIIAPAVVGFASKIIDTLVAPSH